jgi:histidinol-phosphate aminotransferase
MLDFVDCKFKAKFLYERLKEKGIILRSIEDGYKIKNSLRLTIGSRNENLRFMNVVESIFRK